MRTAARRAGAQAAAEVGIHVEEAWGPGKILLEIYEKTTEPELWGPVFVIDYPAEVSPLARRHRDGPELVERYEPVVAGRELGNGFTELIDPDDQRARFEEQAAKARAGDDEERRRSTRSTSAPSSTACPRPSGFGLGVDRLLMLLGDVANIREVIAFPTLRPGPRADPRSSVRCSVRFRATSLTPPSQVPHICASEW